MENAQLIIVYYLELENQKQFLFAPPILPDGVKSNETDGDEDARSATIMLTCQLLFDFVKNNPPIRIMHKTTVCDLCEVDCYVKKNMKLHGIEKVRGGTYSMEVIPDNLLAGIELELLNSNATTISTEHKIANDIINKYKYNDNTRNLTTERLNLQTAAAEYKSILAKRDRICNGLDRTFLKDLEWIRNYSPSSNGKISVNDRHKYEDVLFKMKSLYTSFTGGIYISTPFPYLKYPEFVLDTLFFHSRHISDWEKFETDKQDILNQFEYMAYWTFNRVDEYDFDIFTIIGEGLDIFEIKYNLSMKYFDLLAHSE